MATITVAGLIAAYPEWANAPSDVLDHAVAVANSKPLGLYTDRSVSDETEEIHRRYLEASSILFHHPYSRDMRETKAEEDPYRMEAKRTDKTKGTLYRCPGWPEVS